MFEHIPTYDFYRTLQLKTRPLMQGEDVWALQKALDELGFEPGPTDGIFGQLTDSAVKKAQKRLEITVDGLAGGGTQKALAMAIAGPIAASKHVRLEALKGQMEWESAGFRLGAYSPVRDDGSYDVGVTQRNTEHTPAEQGFDPYLSINALATEIRKHYDLFEGIPEKRRWVLAQGSWNAPAFACYLAKQEGAKKVTKGMLPSYTPSRATLKTFEEYMAQVSKYLPDYI
jgi:peptidoglycan hydrolase-like protein with peptidoglycan-binding domain